jgi:TolB protein
MSEEMERGHVVEDHAGGEEQKNVLERLRDHLTSLWRWLRRPNEIGAPLTLRPRSVRLLVMLILGNLAVLIALTLALYQAAQTPTSAYPSQPLIATPTAGPSPTPGPTPTPLGSGGAVAFTLRKNGNADIYGLNQETKQLVRLTNSPAEDRDPAWSPDGSYIAFASNRADNWDIYLLDLASGALIRLTHAPDFDANPTWSSDGRWIAFESYRSGNLDIYVMSTEGEHLQRVTTSSAPDYAPAWTPDGDAIAFTSYRDGNKDIYLKLLDNDSEQAINITNSPDLDEDEAAWSPNGTRLAYVSGPRGNPSVQVTTFDWEAMEADQSQTELFGAGASPAWAPDGTTLLYKHTRAGYSYLVAASTTGWALFHELYTIEGPMEDLAWSQTALAPRIIDRAQKEDAVTEPPFFVEVVKPTPTAGAPYQLVDLPDVDVDRGEALLSDRVNESFNALRRRIVEEAGWDYLGQLTSAWRPITYTPPSGHSRRTWYVCGRAVGLDQDPYEGDDPRVELIREDVGNVTYWRVFIRATEQDGSMGEPLREAPWDLNARYDGGRAEVEGGSPRASVPSGYYIDLTTLADDYGWKRVPSLWRWRHFWPDIRWWTFQKAEDLDWWEAILEIFEPEEIEPVFGPVPEDRE